MQKPTFNRRAFLQGAVASSLGVALGGASQRPALPTISQSVLSTSDLGTISAGTILMRQEFRRSRDCLA